MKSSIETPKNHVHPYPCIRRRKRQDTNLLVLFTSKNTGVVLFNDAQPNDNPVGKYSSGWIDDMEYWEPYTGKITIEVNNGV